MNSAAEELNGLKDDYVWRPLPHAAMLRLWGADVASWLQGQVTQDLRGIQPGESTLACLCRATGQLEDVLSIRRREADWLVFAERPEVLLKRIEEFVIMEDVQVEEIAGIPATIAGPNAAPPEAAIASNRLGVAGWDVILDAALDRPSLSDDAWNAATLAAKVPLLGVDTIEKTLPPELGREFEARTINYTKGCYSGQEVLMRIHSRGHTNKTWIVVRGDESLPGVHRAAEHPEHGWLASMTVRNESLESLPYRLFD